MASITSSPRTVEEIFKDYSARRIAIIRALTYGKNPKFDFYLPHYHAQFKNFHLWFSSLSLSDVEEFCSLCDPGKFSSFLFYSFIPIA